MGFEENREIWSHHYTREKSTLKFPDENVVRFLHKKNRSGFITSRTTFLDLGCGAGRHLNLLRQFSGISLGCDFAVTGLGGQENVLAADARFLPFEDNFFDCIISWGMLHYLDAGKLDPAMNEIYRVLRSGGIFFGTIRSGADTHLHKVTSGGDLQGGSARLYSREDALQLFKKFSTVETGHITRQYPGDAGVIAHHIIEAVK